jgi:hypothetical protein
MLRFIATEEERRWREQEKSKRSLDQRHLDLRLLAQRGGEA